MKEQTNGVAGAAKALNNVGNVHSKMGQPREALRHWEESLEIRRKLVEAHPKVLEFQVNLAADYLNAGSAYSLLHEPARALRSWETARNLHEQLARDNPSLTQVRQPVYKKSVQRWRNYEEALKPLFAVIDS